MNEIKDELFSAGAAALKQGLEIDKAADKLGSKPLKRLGKQLRDVSFDLDAAAASLPALDDFDFGPLTKFMQDLSGNVWNSALVIQRAATYHLAGESMDLIQVFYDVAEKLYTAGDSLDILIDILGQTGTPGNKLPLQEDFCT